MFVTAHGSRLIAHSYTMVIGILQLQLGIPWATSLKDKRRVVQSLKAKLHREHQVSVAEVDTLDSHTTATLGITLASNDVSYTQSVLDRILEKLQHARDFTLDDQRIDILSGK